MVIFFTFAFQLSQSTRLRWFLQFSVPSFSLCAFFPLLMFPVFTLYAYLHALVSSTFIVSLFWLVFCFQTRLFYNFDTTLSFFFRLHTFEIRITFFAHSSVPFELLIVFSLFARRARPTTHHHPHQGRERRTAILHQSTIANASSRTVKRSTRHTRLQVAGSRPGHRPQYSLLYGSRSKYVHLSFLLD